MWGPASSVIADCTSEGHLHSRATILSGNYLESTIAHEVVIAINKHDNVAILSDAIYVLEAAAPRRSRPLTSGPLDKVESAVRVHESASKLARLTARAVVDDDCLKGERLVSEASQALL
jgi:hypothetical protein